MTAITGRRARVHGREEKSKSVLYLRMVELIAFFVIVFVARELTGFRYPSSYLLLWFLGAAVLQAVGLIPKSLWHRWFGWSDREVSTWNRWYSSVVDLLAVVGIVYLTGTIESPFLFLLVVPLFFSSQIFSWRTSVFGYLPATVLVIGVLGWLELSEAIPHFSCYENASGAFLNPHYFTGSLLVLSGFLSLILFLSNAFQHHFNDSIDSLYELDKEKKVKIHELSRLYDISLGINAVMTVETLLKMVAKEATLLLSQPWASIVLFNDKLEITHSVIVGIPENFLSSLGTRIRKGGLTEWIHANNEPIIVDDVLLDKRAATGEFLLATNIRSLIGIPLTNGHRVMGGIYVGDFVRKRFEEKHARLLSIMCDQLAIAIAKSKLYESLRRKIQDFEKRVENLERVNHLKSEYVSHVSHELRTPLTSIKAYVETMFNHVEDLSLKERREFLGIVSKESERLIRIVNDILDVSNIEFGQRQLQRTSFNVQEILHEVVQMMQPKLDEKAISVEVEGPDTLPPVDADKDLLVQVCINLITNAVKYSPEGTQVRVRATEEPVDIKVSIEDQGIGIPETQIDKIFERYFRVKSEQSRHYDGVGLGLAIVKNIIEQHGGSINVTSEENVGSVFTFTIPKKPCANDLLGYIAKSIGARSELHEMLTLIVRMIAELLGAKIVSLMLLDQNRRELFIKVSYGLDEWIVDQARVKVGEGIAGRVAQTGEPLLIDNIEKNGVFMSPNNPQYETMSLVSVPLSVQDMIVGVVNVNNKVSGERFNQDDLNLLVSFAARISMALDRMRTTENTNNYLRDTIEAFRKMVERQIQTRSIEAIVDLAVKLSRKMGLKEKEVKVIQYVASVHDIGMTTVSDEILDKTFHLTPEEIEQIRIHPEVGAELIRPLEFVEAVSNIILYHHERVDGMGYPMGLKGDQIPIGARVLAIIDAYQSMTTERPYRGRLSVRAAIAEIVDCAGKQFDVEAVKYFIDVLRDEGAIGDDEQREFRRALKGVVHATER
jgi:signal transduction histidine kinase/HD-GYP domain-containing protein (c-di-GMP phosphodiesterase class II)